MFKFYIIIMYMNKSNMRIHNSYIFSEICSSDAAYLGFHLFYFLSFQYKSKWHLQEHT